MFVHDGAATLSRERTPEGFLRVRARISRAGIHDYKAGEIGGPAGAPPDRTVRVYRPPEDVFDPASLSSFAAKPVTLDHPPRMVDAANWKLFAVGHSGQAIVREDDHVAADLVITDAEAVARAEAGAELSNGYWADFVFEPGQTPDGQSYDAVQRNIRGNHIALVDAGRCGPSCRVEAAPADSACGCKPPDAANRQSVMVDGVAITADAAGVAAIEKLRSALDEARARHRSDIALKDDEIAALKAAVPDAATLDALAEERVVVVDAARALLGPAFDGCGRATASIRRATVERLLGPAKVRDRNDDYVAAAFDALLAARLRRNPLAAHVTAGLADGASSSEAALADRNHYLTHAWKGETLPGV